MPDTPRTLAALQALLADNTAAAISPQDIRDFLVSLFAQTTKGDLAGIDAAGIIGRLPATTDGFVLTLDATQTYGFKWAAAAPAGAAGGELAGTYPNPTVAASHAGSTHAAAQAAAEATAAAALTAHEGAADPHAGYMTPAEHTAVGDGSPHHAAATAGVDGEHSFAGQVLSGVDAGAAQKGHIQLAGDLGGTAASPSVNATHAGSAHHAQSHGNADHTTAYTDDTTVNNHIADAADAHDASAISILDTAGDFTATDVEGALAELQADAEAHAAAADPHTGYRLESADHTHQSTGAQAGQLDHGLALTGLGDDDHTQYVQKATLTTRGDLYVRDASAVVRKALGASGTVLRSDGTDPQWATLYSRAKYVNVPDAAVGVTITAGDAQGAIFHSGPNAETADALEVDAETAPGASGLPVTWQYGDTNDLDTVASWTTIATYTLSSEKSNRTTSMTNATIPANRLIRTNWGTIVGTPKDATSTLHVKSPLVT